MTREDFDDPDLVFNPVEHVYTWNNQVLTSITRLVEQYSVPFDAAFHAARVAKREKKPKEQVLREWQHKSIDAASRGTAIHEEAERIASCVSRTGGWSHPVEQGESKLAGCKRALWKWWEAHSELAYGHAIPEVRICYPRYGLAGTVDMVCGLNGIPTVVDFKTSAELPLFGYRRMLPPLESLRGTNFWGYCLQLNLYRQILRDRYGYDTDAMVLVWLKPNGVYQEIRVPDLEWAVTKMLETRCEHLLSDAADRHRVS